MVPELTSTKWIEPVGFGIAGPADVYRAAELAGSFADSLGFTPADRAEIALVVTELASNLVQHTSGGTVRFSRIEAAGKIGIQIESEDSGPGISDLERAITDGYSTAGSLGIGLGTVNRLTDELAAYPQPERGVRIVCQRWMRPSTSGISAPDLAFGAATRSYRRLPENGDAFIIKQWGRNAIAGVIDGVGHGPFAQRASQTARQYVEQHFDQPLESIFRGVGRACRATRGVVMALARFDLNQQKLTVASVGNVEVRLIGSPERFNLVVKRGIVGLNAPSPVPTEHPWTSTSLLIMHSDGLPPHWAWNEFPDLPRAAPAVVARRLLQVLGKIDDDATVIVARNSIP
jgi:anti-sigma regulatory factor (Ser/Thr protein kinase)/serine/threonine protein phosphatase PrpC